MSFSLSGKRLAVTKLCKFYVIWKLHKMAENNYVDVVECDCLPDAYLLKIGTAMGTSFQ